MHPGGDDVVAASAIMPARCLDQSRVDRSTPLLAQGSRLSKLLAGILVLVLAALLVGWLMRDPSRRKPAVIDGGRGFEMHYSPIQVTVGWIVLGLVSLGCLASRPLEPRFQLPWALATAAILLPLLVQAWSRRYRLQVLGAGLRALSPWRPRVEIRWSEMRAVEWLPRREALRVRSAQGASLVIPAQLVGMGQLESVLRAKLPRALLDEPLARLHDRLELRYGTRRASAP